MREVAIIGAGELGGACAHALARRDVARAITIVDEKGRVAAGKALDIAQAAPVEGFATQLNGVTDISAASGADVVVIADRFAGGEWQGEDALALLRRLSQLAARTIVVCAGAAAREAIERGVGELKWPRQRLFGTAPEALAGGARAMIALATDHSPLDVTVSVLGVPPADLVIPWSDATIGGFSAADVLGEPIRRQLDARIRALWPPGPFALAAAATKAIAAIAGRSRRDALSFIAPEQPSRTRAAAMPVQLGAGGIVAVRQPILSTVEKVALDNATAR